MLRGSPQERLRLLFRVNSNETNGMTVMDVAALIQDSQSELKVLSPAVLPQLSAFHDIADVCVAMCCGGQDVIKFAKEVVATLDTDHSGEVSAGEFLKCLAKEPLLLQTFQSCVQVTVSGTPDTLLQRVVALTPCVWLDPDADGTRHSVAVSSAAEAEL